MIKMKNIVLLITLKKCTYDEFDSFTIISASKSKKYIFKLIKKDYEKEPTLFKFNYSNFKSGEDIEEITEIGYSDLEEQIVSSSFNAG